MSGRQPWLVLGGLILLTAILVVVAGPTRGGRSPNHESSSDAPDGTSALRLYAQALGHPASALEGDSQLPSAPGVVFVFSPLAENGFSSAQTLQLMSWVSAGGLLIYAAESGDPQLDQRLALVRRTDQVDADTSPSAPILGGLQRVKGADQARPFRSGSQQVPLLRNSRGDVLAVTMALGQGRVVALSDPLVLCNAYLGQADNGRLAADLLALAAAGSPVLFDEFHHTVPANGSSPVSWITTVWGAGVVWAVVILIVGLAIRGRAFGPRIPLASAGARSSAEYATAVGGLLRRAGARSLTLQALDGATRRLCGERLGLHGDVQSVAFLDALRHRAPPIGARLAAVEARMSDASQSDVSFLEVAHLLHEVAFSPAEPAARKSA